MKSITDSRSNMITFLILIAMFLLVACEDKEDVRPGDRITEQDRLFARNAAYSNLANVEFGQIPGTNSADQMILVYGQEIVSSYKAAHAQLTEISTARTIAIPDEMSAENQMRHQKLSALFGLEFDSIFLANQVAIHIETRDIYQNQVDMGTNDALREYAFQFLPEIVSKLDQVVVLQSERFPADN